MNSIFSATSGVQAGMFRLQQAKKAWERDMAAMDHKDAQQRFSDKVDQITQPFAFKLTPEQQRNHTAAVSALEEAKRVGGPKAAAEQKLEQVERKMAELKVMMRFSHGNREKLAQLAREAAILAREAGRAAKSYGEGMSAQAEMGLPGGAGTSAGVTVEHTVTRTTLTVVQTEVSVNLTITLRPDGTAGDPESNNPATTNPPAGPPNPQDPDQAAAQPDAAQAGTDAATAALAQDVAASADADDQPSATDANQVATDASATANKAASGVGTDDEAARRREEEERKNGDPANPTDLARSVGEALAGQRTGNGLSGPMGRAVLQRMIADNDMKISRYREADGFGRRVEKVLSDVKNIIGEAKAANELEQSLERRKARKETFRAYDKIVDGAQEEVNRLRQAAFGSSVSMKDFVDAAKADDGADRAESNGTPADGEGADGGASDDLFAGLDLDALLGNGGSTDGGADANTNGAAGVAADAPIDGTVSGGGVSMPALPQPTVNVLA